MLAVFEAFAVIGVVILVGVVVGRTGVLGDNARMVLNRVAFHVGVPALLLLSLSSATLDQIFSLPLLVTSMCAVGAFAVGFVTIAVLRGRPRGYAAVAGWSSSYANAGNLGLPLSAYVFGNTTAVSAVILFQVVVLVPLGIAVLNSSAEPRRSPGRQVLTLLSNPIIAASVVGLILAALHVTLPKPVVDPLQLLADLAIPTVLLAFGISLSSRAEKLPPGDRVDAVIVLLIKILAMPAAAYAIARWGFAARPDQVMVATVLAGLPAAQNINAYAAVYGRGESLARDATLISTVLSVPVIAVVVTALGG
jgi:malonate transporter and related proteins